MLPGLRMRRRAVSSLSYTVAMLAMASLHRSLAGAHGQQVFDAYVHRWAGGILQRAGCSLAVTTLTDPRRCALIRPRQWQQALEASQRPRLIVANHRSSLDIPILLRCFGGSVLSKSEVQSWPVIGRAALGARTIFADRNDPRSGFKAIRAMRSVLGQARPLCVFPEGTTHEGDEVRAFLPGCFAALRGLDAEIIPVGLAYPEGTEFIEDSFVGHARKLGLRPNTPIGISVGPAMLNLGDPQACANAVRNAVQDQVHRARTQVLTATIRA